MSKWEIDGVTGHRVIVDTDGDPYMPGTYVKVYVDRLEREIIHRTRARDGGTTFLHLDGGDTIMYPNKIGSEDRTPKFNGEDIRE